MSLLKNIVLFPVLSLLLTTLAHASSLNLAYQYKNVQIFKSNSSEVLVISKTSLTASTADFIKSLDDQTTANDINIVYGYLTKQTLIAKKEIGSKKEFTYKIFNYSPYTNYSFTSYKRYILEQEQLTILDYAGSENYGPAVDLIFNNAHHQNRAQSVWMSLLINSAHAGACNLVSTSIQNQINSIIDSVRIDCTKPQYQQDGTLSSIKNIIKGCVAGLASGVLDTIQFVVESLELIYNMATDSKYRQQLVNSASTVLLQTQVDPKAQALAAMKAAMAGLHEVSKNFASCGLQYQALQFCQVIKYVIPPTAIALIAAKIAKKKLALKAAAPKTIPKIPLSETGKVPSPAATATKEMWAEAAQLEAPEISQEEWKKIQEQYKRKQEQAKQEKKEKEERKQEIIRGNNSKFEEAEYHGPDSELAKQYESVYKEMKKKAQKEAQEMAKKREREAAEREAKKRAEKEARMRGEFPEKTKHDATIDDLNPENLSKEELLRRIREENKAMIEQLHLDQ